MSIADEFPIEVNSDEGLYRNSDIPKASGLKEAAVLMPFIRVEDAWHLLFIVRATNPRDRHSGQVAFPGGRREDNDHSLVHTALRETEEEIGVGVSQIQVIGSLAAYLTVSDYAVTPVVAIMKWPQPLKLQTDEVARTLSLPVDWLATRSNFSLRARRELDQRSNERHPVIVYQEQQNAVLWGATARMTVNCLKSLTDGELSLTPPLDLPQL